MIIRDYRNSFINENISLIIISIKDLINKYFPELTDKENRVNSSLKFHDSKFIKEYFNEEEISKIEQFKSFKRQVEWISGRFAIKTLILKRHPEIDIKSCHINSKEGGSPYLSEYPDWQISITHSRDYAAGAISYDGKIRVGIDLERIGGEKTTSFLKLVFTHKEIEYLKGKGAEKMFLSWCIKEAYVKLIEKGFNMCMKKIEVFDNDIYIGDRKADEIIVHNEKIEENYILAVVSNKQ